MNNIVYQTLSIVTFIVLFGSLLPNRRGASVTFSYFQLLSATSWHNYLRAVCERHLKLSYKLQKRLKLAFDLLEVA